MNRKEELSYAKNISALLFAGAALLFFFNIESLDIRKAISPPITFDVVPPVVEIDRQSEQRAERQPSPQVEPQPESQLQQPQQQQADSDAPSLPPLPPLPPSSSPQQAYLQKGETLFDFLAAQNVISSQEAYSWSDAIASVYDVKTLTTDNKIEFRFTPAEAGEQENRGEDYVKILLTATDYVEARRDNDGDIVAELLSVPTEMRQYLLAGTITSSFYEAAVAAGLPANYLEQMILIFSFDVDFQRDIRKYDSFEVLYEAVMDNDGGIISRGDILSMSLTVNRLGGGKERRYFLYRGADGTQGYYDKSGVSVEKSLMKTPIDGARLSSGYGYRKHPILGYTKLHKGVDFAAPKGTPVYAAGNGVVEYAGRNGSYGGYIRIRHDKVFKTAYAHLSGYAKSVRAGATVQQGQVIGYVGSTGRSTGPHLHYEIIQNGKAINPTKLRLPSAEKLTGEQMLEFQKQHREILQLVARLAQ